jgi:hypothetical protein
MPTSAGHSARQIQNRRAGRTNSGRAASRSPTYVVSQQLSGAPTHSSAAGPTGRTRLTTNHPHAAAITAASTAGAPAGHRGPAGGRADPCWTSPSTMINLHPADAPAISADPARG